MRTALILFIVSIGFLIGTPRASAAPVDEFKIKRQEVYEFTEKPRVVRQGDAISISFTSKAFCDATVAIESADGRIVRHLASGVLGANAPAPFQKNSLHQTLAWDGKNDKGEYIDDKDSLTIRVSLGLKPSFERDLLVEPKRRHGRDVPIFQVGKDGVYVYEGGDGRDFVRFYNHDGKYGRTIYPFPADKIEKVLGLKHVTYPQDGLSLPVKPTYLQQTFLTCGNLYGYDYPKKYALPVIQADGDNHFAMYGNASSILAVQNGRIALGKTYLCRLATDGTSGGVEMEGPAVSLLTDGSGNLTHNHKVAIAPRSSALSPDGKTLYLTGYTFCHYGTATHDILTSGNWHTFPCVMKMAVEGDEQPKLFAGSLELDTFGNDNKSFKVPASVAVDDVGRVYVADYMNDRIQIFSPAGDYLKTIATPHPSIVSIDGKTQDIYVFSTLIHNIFMAKKTEALTATMSVFGPFANPSKRSSCPLPAEYSRRMGGNYSGSGFTASAAVDGFTDPPTIWLASEWTRENILTKGRIEFTDIELYAYDGKRLALKDDFGDDVKKSIQRIESPRYARSRLYANPKNGKVYVGEGEAFDYKSFKTLIELDPQTGKIALVPIPFDAEDMCFDQDGFAYLRTISIVARYDPSSNWREVPFDYGEQRTKTGTSFSSDGRHADVLSGLPLPANGGWHHGGLFVAANGNIVVACGVVLEAVEEEKEEAAKVDQPGGKLYARKMFPGRSNAGRGGAPLVHVWDKHGQIVFEDAIPGISGTMYGIAIDRDNALYLMSNATRVLEDGNPYLNKLSGTLMKAIPKKSKILSLKSMLFLPESEQPKRPIDLIGNGMGHAWAEGVEWMYGGVGFDGKNAGNGCACWNARAAFDYFARSFAPEIDRYRIAVLDSNGNLILRIGRYGNCDSAGPQSMIPLGGDEVGLVHGAYLATDTDRRLFVADGASDRIFSVKLGYHAEERVSLKNVPEK